MVKISVAVRIPLQLLSTLWYDSCVASLPDARESGQTGGIASAEGNSLHQALKAHGEVRHYKSLYEVHSLTSSRVIPDLDTCDVFSNVDTFSNVDADSDYVAVPNSNCWSARCCGNYEEIGVPRYLEERERGISHIDNGLRDESKSRETDSARSVVHIRNSWKDVPD